MIHYFIILCGGDELLCIISDVTKNNKYIRIFIFHIIASKQNNLQLSNTTKLSNAIYMG